MRVEAGEPYEFELGMAARRARTGALAWIETDGWGKTTSSR